MKWFQYLVVDLDLMNKEGINERSQDKEEGSELFGDKNRSDTLSEYDFFLPEADQTGKHLPEDRSLEEKRKNENHKSELVDFFLPSD